MLWATAVQATRERLLTERDAAPLVGENAGLLAWLCDTLDRLDGLEREASARATELGVDVPVPADEGRASEAEG